MSRKVGGGGAVPLSVAGAGSPSNTVWPGPRCTSVPSGILISSTVWPQYANVTDGQTDRTSVRSIGRTVTCNGRPRIVSQSTHAVTKMSTRLHYRKEFSCNSVNNFADVSNEERISKIGQHFDAVTGQSIPVLRLPQCGQFPVFLRHAVY